MGTKGTKDPYRIHQRSPHTLCIKIGDIIEIYDKLVELFFVSTVGEVISLRQELYNMKILREYGIASYFMRVS